MATAFRVIEGAYQDSVKLMRVSAAGTRLPGVEATAALMGTEANQALLLEAGFDLGALAAGPNDLILAARAGSEEEAEAALEAMAGMLAERPQEGEGAPLRTLPSALRLHPERNLCLLSVPGPHVRREAKRALEAGLHLMIFSDNVPLEDEVYLKDLAEERGLLVMGPDCGTAILGGLGLAFSNAVAQGPVGIVGASGTGIQAASVLIDRAGSGISHAIGTGGRDLSEEVGGRTMIRGIRLLAQDEGTRALLLLSKPPHPKVMERVLEAARGCGKPVVVLFLGGDPQVVRQFGATPAADLEEAALLAVELAQGKKPLEFQIPSETVQAWLDEERRRLLKGARWVRGLYSGGTLCEEAILILQDFLGLIHSNVPLRPEGRLEDPRQSRDHSVIDLGEDFFTRGRPHPMIDPGLRNERLLREAEDPTVAILLLDVVLGYGAHPDPAGELAKAIREVKGRREICVVASVCGTERDPQRLSRQEAALREAGARLFPSNAQAARFAGRLAQALTP